MQQIRTADSLGGGRFRLRGDGGLQGLDDLSQQARRIIRRAHLQVGVHRHGEGAEGFHQHVFPQQPAAMQPTRRRRDEGRRLQAHLPQTLQADRLPQGIPRRGLTQEISPPRTAVPLVEVKEEVCGFPGGDPQGRGPHGLQKGPQILLGYRIAAQELRRRRRPGLHPAGGDQIGDRKIGAVSEIGDRKAQLLQDRDPRVVDVVIGPLAAAEPAEQRHGLAAQGCVVHRRVGWRTGGNDGSGVGHGSGRGAGYDLGEDETIGSCLGSIESGNYLFGRPTPTEDDPGRCMNNLQHISISSQQPITDPDRSHPWRIWSTNLENG